MGYTTEFYGQINVDPPLNEQEQDYLERFSGSRRMARRKGPYYAEPGSNFGQDRAKDVTAYNDPPVGQPGLWCQWVPGEEGKVIEWNQGEKFYDSAEWMQYIIDHFFKPGAHVRVVRGDPAFDSFTFDHVLNGEIEAQGESGDDRWLLVVENNVVSTKQGTIVYE